jgi:two-component system, cell cycle sensor histidine kinase and response regulator CckA
MEAAGDQASGATGAVRRRTTDETLLRSGITCQALLESASQAILSVDAKGRILFANARSSEMFGYTVEELTGQTIEMLLPAAARENHITHRAEYFAKPRVRPMGLGLDLAGRRKDGTEFPVEISLSYVETGSGLSALALVTDITERKRLEEQLLRSQKMEAVGRLAGGVAHDFNNMLTIISGYNQLLLSHLTPEGPPYAYAEEIRKTTERAAALTKQLLAFSRGQVIQPKVLDMNGLLTGISTMLQPLLGEDVALVLRLQPDLGRVKADPGQLEQVILNLAVNARDAMPKGGRLTIETADVKLDRIYAWAHLGVQPGTYVMMAISDTGEGMNAETRKHMFEPFFTTKERGKGTGLGLATAYGIVKQSGGDMWVYSEPGKGTTIRIYLPKVDLEVSQTALPAKPHTKSEARETVLVVEDDTGVARLVSELLRQSGYTVLEAKGSQEAVELVESHQGPLDLLLTDVVMPRMSGPELARVLVAARPGLKVVYTSGYAESTVALHSESTEGMQFLAKPFALESLLAKVREVLDMG